MRCEMARGSTRANFSPGSTPAICVIVFSISGVGAPVTVTVDTENIDDQANRYTSPANIAATKIPAMGTLVILRKATVQPFSDDGRK